LEFAGGVTVTGKVERTTRSGGRLVLVSLSGCRVTRGSRVLFEPAWGTYDMAVGERIVSVYHGAADKDAYDQVAFVPKERTIKVNVNDATRNLHTLYRAVREIRESGNGAERLSSIWHTVRDEHPSDWLLPLEILELLVARGIHPELQSEVRAYLERRGATELAQAKLIANGLRLLNER
jgi:phenylalanine-4-hydroxylase